MDKSLKLLVSQIKEGKVTVEDAANQFKLLAVQNKQQFITSSRLKDDYNLTPEVYVYNEPYLKDHTIFGEQVLIGMTHGSLALNAFFKFFPQESSVHLHKLNFVKPIEVKKNQQVEIIVEPINHGSRIEFQVMYRYMPAETWDLTATGMLQKAIFKSNKINLESMKESLEESHNFSQMYASNPAASLGDSFKTITHLYKGKDRVLARIALSKTSREEEHNYVLHPLIIHSAYVAVSPLLESLSEEDSFLPFGIKDIYFQNITSMERCWLLVKLVKNSGEMIIFDVDVIDEESRIVAQFSGCSIKRLRINQVSSNEYRVVNDNGTQQQIRKISEESHRSEAIPSTFDFSVKIQKYLKDKLNKIIQDRSRLSNLEVNLMDLGLQSSQLVALTNEIEEETSIELYPTLFFEYPNIKELTEYFCGEHKESFIRLLGFNSTKSKSDFEQAVNVSPPVVTQEKSESTFNELHRSTSNVKITVQPALDDIAIIGMNGRLAGSSNLDQFWENICKKKDLVTEIPIDHWDYRLWYDENPQVKDKTYSKWGSFIDDVDKFDAPFFNISPREANWMDPQIRLLLQSVYATGEDAGYINQLRGTNTGVFVGVCSHDYMERITEMNLPVDPYVGTGNSHTVIANRISFLFDFTGPSITMDTACSSSLFALHYACQALRNKECNMAFVAGVNLLLSSFHYRYFCSIGALSPTGRCHTFDEAADGYVPGECVASVLLKPLEQAEKDGDHIYAIIKGSAALHGGYTPSLTAPSVVGEENVILKAWENAGIHPETLSYIEAHGTGTKLGDPIEINSLKKAFKRFTSKEKFCAIGSAKSNIGHAEGAAGIAGILKVILQLKHKQIPAMPQFKTLNPYIQLDKSPLYINREHEEWKSTDGIPRRAGISSFGFAGAYAHIVIEEYIPEQWERPQMLITAQNPAIIVLSAKNKERLQVYAKRLLSAIQDRKFLDTDLADIAYTLQVGRESMEERLGLIVLSIKELEEKLKDFLQGRNDIEDLYQGQVKPHKETLASLVTDEDMLNTITAWINKRKYAKLLDLWVKGLNFDWNKLYGDNAPQRISLPTYPFAKERYWIPEIRNPATAEKVAFAPTASLIQPSISQQSLQQATVSEANFLRKPDIASGIVLRSLSDHQFPSKSADQIRPSIILLSTDVATSQSKVSDVSNTVLPIQGVVSTELLDELASSLAEVLAMARADIDVDEQFVEMGLDSITGVEWIQKINKRYGISLAATKVYDYPNIREFSAFLGKELNKQGSRFAASGSSMSDHSLLQSNQSPMIIAPTIDMKATEPINKVRKKLVANSISVESLLDELASSLAQVLAMSRGDIDVDEQFVEMGLDSITGVEWIQLVNKRYGTLLAATKVYDYPNVREFAAFLEKELNKQGNRFAVISGSSMPDQPLLQPNQSPNVVAPTINMAATEPIDKVRKELVLNPISAQSLLDELASSLAQVLAMDRGDIDVDEQFVEMGLDSITGVEWIQMINKRYGTSLAATKVYDYPNIRSFASFLTKELNNDKGGEAKQIVLNAPSKLSLQVVLQQVQSGMLDIENADQLLQNF
jgi:acyl transferase domain-containing protein